MGKSEADLLLSRMADDGTWYTFEEFQTHYKDGAKERWDQAPMYLDRRRGPESKNKYEDAEWWFRHFGSDDRWKNHDKPGWDTAPRKEKCLADDGKWYTLKEFKEFYPRDWDQRWKNAPSDEERRMDSDRVAHDAEWFFNENQLQKGRDWSLNVKTLWDTATKMPEDPRRLADDGKWYTNVGFREFYPHDYEERWTNAPEEGVGRLDCYQRARDAEWFCTENTKKGGRDWSKNYKTEWDEAKPAEQTSKLPVQLPATPAFTWEGHGA